MRRLWLAAGLLLCATAAQAQPNSNNRYFVFDDCAALSSAACDVTLQQPATGSLWVDIEYVEVYCSVACTVTVSRDGTAATTTAATEVSVNGGPTATATAFIDSDAGAGTTVMTFRVGAATTIGRDMTGFFLEDSNSTANNLTVQTNSITGDASIYIRWRETSR